MEFLAARPCTGNSYVVYPRAMYNLPLHECGRVLARNGWHVKDMDLMIDARSRESTFTLYRTGRLLINPCPDEKTALERAASLFGTIENDRKLGRILRGEGALL